MNRINTILFDWDGTLIDTAQHAYKAFVKQLHSYGIQLDLETYESIYSPNWYGMYEALRLPREKWKEADDLWLQYYGSEMPKLMPGALVVLDALDSRGYALGLVTSGTRGRVLREIKELGFTHRFGIVICSDDVVNGKPHPEGLELAMRRMGRTRERCCYVGDSPDDVDMGRHAGVLTIGIPGRYPTGRKLLDSHPDLLLDSLDQCLNVFCGAGREAVRV